MKCKNWFSILFSAMVLNIFSYPTLGENTILSNGVNQPGPIIGFSSYVDGQLIVATENDLISILIKSGETELITKPLAKGKITAVSTSLAGPPTLYVATEQSGIARSRDSGVSWSSLAAKGLPQGPITAITNHAEQENTIYVYMPEHGIYRSEDAGLSWELMDAGPQGMANIFVHTNMPGSMQTGWLFAATDSGISRSMDCFCLWQEAGEIKGKIISIIFDRKMPSHLYVLTDKAIYQSRNGGEDWILKQSPSEGLQDITISADGTIYGIDSAGRLFLSKDQSISWSALKGYSLYDQQ